MWSFSYLTGLFLHFHYYSIYNTCIKVDVLIYIIYYFNKMHGHFFSGFDLRVVSHNCFVYLNDQSEIIMLPWSFLWLTEFKCLNEHFERKKYVVLLTLLQCIVINWIIDSYPEIADGIVVKTVCVRSTKSCCETSFTIGVRNCSSYYSFYLTNVPTCNQSYCFGM